jgi:hypothetical protein
MIARGNVGLGGASRLTCGGALLCGGGGRGWRDFAFLGLCVRRGRRPRRPLLRFCRDVGWRGNLPPGVCPRDLSTVHGVGATGTVARRLVWLLFWCKRVTCGAGCRYSAGFLPFSGSVFCRGRCPHRPLWRLPPDFWRTADIGAATCRSGFASLCVSAFILVQALTCGAGCHVCNWGEAWQLRAA